jgi:hypothetical protein
LFEAKTSQPPPNVHGRIRVGSTGSWCKQGGVSRALRVGIRVVIEMGVWWRAGEMSVRRGSIAWNLDWRKSKRPRRTDFK